MTDTTGTLNDVAFFDNLLSSQTGLHRAILGAVILGFGTMGIAWMMAPSLTARRDIPKKAAVRPPRVALANPYGALPVTAYSFRSQPIVTAARSAPEVPVHVKSSPSPPAAPPAARVAPPPQSAQELAARVPLPPPRPPLARPRAHHRSLDSVARHAGSRVTEAKAAAPAPDNRNFFQKLFDVPRRPSGSALAYAQPEDTPFSRLARHERSSALPPHGRFTAIYDIKAHTVYMPDGEKLEAHSGRGKLFDNPRRVNVKARGPTPPHMYDLALRKRLFHGVRALRLTPVGSGTMYGRTGFLAHTYMLGPKGESMGCVSFKNYSKFLHAFLKGKVKRLIVVGQLS